MSSEEVEAGKVWVEGQLRELAVELGIVVKTIEWLPQGADAFDRDYWIVVVHTQTGNSRDEITVKDLEDHGTSKMRHQLRRRLRALLLRSSRVSG
jgi:hypothetical protein